MMLYNFIISLPENIMMEWKYIGEGTFNMAYRSDFGKGDLIFKVAKQITDKVSKKPLKILKISNFDTMDNYARSVRIWNDINSDIRPPAYIEQTKIEGETVEGWVCPYVEGVQAPDLEIAQKLIEIYNRTGRIIVDAPSSNNFLKTPTGKIVCIDVGLAVQLEKREEVSLLGLPYRSSFSSLEIWDDSAVDTYSDYFETPICKKNPQTTKTIKALLYIKENRQDIHQVDFLNTDPSTLTNLAKAYDTAHRSSNAPIPSRDETNQTIKDAEERLMQKQDLSLEELKQCCRGKLSQIIAFCSPHSKDAHRSKTLYDALGLLQKVNLCEKMEEINSLCTTIKGMPTTEWMEEEEQIDTLIINPDTPPPIIQQLHQKLLTGSDKIEELNQAKKQCLDILTQFLTTKGNLRPDQIADLQARFSDPPSKKILYYKLQINNPKLSYREKDLIILIQWIDTAQTFDEIDEFLRKFEKTIPPVFFLEYMGAALGLHPTSAVKQRLIECISKCKLALATAKQAVEHKSDHQQILKGPDLL